MKPGPFYDELINLQINDIGDKYKFTERDIRRLSKYLKTSINHKTECSLWGGYLSNMGKRKYATFTMNKSKLSLSKLIYKNYIGKLIKNQMVSFTCDNRDKCCNINHMYSEKKSRKSLNQKILNDKPITIRHNNLLLDMSDSD